MYKPYRNRKNDGTGHSDPGVNEPPKESLPNPRSTDGSAKGVFEPGSVYGRKPSRGGIRARLFQLIALSLIPMILLFVWFFLDRYRVRRAQAFETELEVSRGLAVTFSAYLSDINNENYAVGRTLAAFGYSDNGTTQRLLQDIASRYAAMESLYWVAPDGTILVSSAEALRGADISERPYFIQLLENGSWVTSDLVAAGLLTGDPIITIATAIREADGTLLGVMVAAIDPSRLSELIHPEERPAGGAYTIFDSNGTLVYRSPEIGLSWEDRTEWVRSDRVLQHVVETGESDVGITDLSIPGGTWVTARVKVPGTEYIAGSGKPMSQVLALVRESVYQGIGFAMLVAFTAFLAASFMAQTISEPLRRLERDAAEMKSGDTTLRNSELLTPSRLPVRVPGEITSLRDTVTRMAADLLSRADALRRERMRLHSALVSAELGTWSILAESRLVMLDVRSRELFGLTDQEDLSIEDVMSRIDSEDRASVFDAIDRALLPDSDGRFDTEFRTYDDSGRRRWLRGTGRCIFEGTGGSRRAMQLLGVVMDMTADKETERKLLELNETLEERVRSRTEQLESVNRELEAFSYSVSHDLRAPLRSIDGFSKLLLEKHAASLSDQARNYLERVRNASQRMGRLIDDLLMLSRIGRKELRRDAVDLSALASGVIEELHGREPDRRVTVTIEPGLFALGDEELIRIVLDNLLSNAWKFTSRTNDATISFSTVIQDGERFYRVRDNGAGFEAAYLDKLFIPFHRLHTESEYPGTGIGLATVKRIVLRHGGRVFAEGAPGEGASFYFSLGGSNEI